VQQVKRFEESGGLLLAMLAWLHTQQLELQTHAVVPYCCLLLPALLQDG